MSIRTAIVGVGNCAAALVQGVEYYRKHPQAPGCIFRDIDGYTIGDIRFVAAFDVNSSKVGKDLSLAIFAPPNNARNLGVKVPSVGWKVSPSPLLDGIGRTYKSKVTTIGAMPNDSIAFISDVLRSSKAEVLINYLPVGSEKATRVYAKACLAAGVHLINAIPVFIGSTREWREQFKCRGLFVLGDDVKSQIGATITHRVLSQMFTERGGSLDTQYQLNFGGNMDFLNMLSDERLKSKKLSKLRSVIAAMRTAPKRKDSMFISPSSYVPFLGDQKVAYIRLEGKGFAGCPLSVETRLQVWDSDNSAGCIVDVLRWLASSVKRMDRRLADSCSAYYFKSPYVNLPDATAYKQLLEVAQRNCSSL